MRKNTTRNSVNSTIWISYDLGVRGDYDGIYKWLDSYNAKECGTSLAVLNYPYSENIIEEIREDINSNIKIDSRTRIYMIYRVREGKSKDKNRGVFLVGGRQAEPWAGYASSADEVIDEEV